MLSGTKYTFAHGFYGLQILCLNVKVVSVFEVISAFEFSHHYRTLVVLQILFSYEKSNMADFVHYKKTQMGYDNVTDSAYQNELITF